MMIPMSKLHLLNFLNVFCSVQINTYLKIVVSQKKGYWLYSGYVKSNTSLNCIVYLLNITFNASDLFFFSYYFVCMSGGSLTYKQGI